MSVLKDLANDLLADHPGFPLKNGQQVAMEIVESMMRIMRKRLIGHGFVYLDGIGKLEVRRHSGAIKKHPKLGVPLKTSSRNVVKFLVNLSLNQMLNMDRPKPERVETTPASEQQVATQA